MNKRTTALGLSGLFGASALLNGCGPAIQYASTQQRDPRMAAAGAIFGAAMHDYEVANYQRSQANVPQARSLSNVIFLCDSVDASNDGDPTSLSMQDMVGQKRDDPAVFFHGRNIGVAVGFVNPAGPAPRQDGWFKKADGTNFFAPDSKDIVCSITLYDSRGNEIYSDSSSFSGGATLTTGWNLDSKDLSLGSYSFVGKINGNVVSRRTLEIVSRQ